MERALRRALASAAFLALTAGSAGAQQAATITGLVTTDAGAPLPSASVVLEGMGLGTLTSADGRYSFTVPAARVNGQTVKLTASGLGYRSQSATITLSGGPISRSFVLTADPLALQEIVVTGAGTQTTRAKLGNTINSVKASEIVKANESNVVNALAAKAPNVEVSSQSGEPGASSYIRIRGMKSIQGSGQPLFVVDGVPIDNSTYSTGGSTGSTVASNRASDINPNDIESIEILKGSAAAAIYGARAANGVVMITTKTGAAGPTRYSLRSSYSLDQVTQGVPLQTRYGQGSGGKPATCAGPGCRPTTTSYGPELAAGTPVFDHWGEMFHDGYSSDNTLNVSGGNDRTTFYLSGGYLHQNGTIVGPNNYYDRKTFRLKATHRLLENLTIGGNAAYISDNQAGVQKGSNISGILLGALRSPPEFDNRVYKDSATGLHRSYRYPRPTALSVTRGYDNPFFVIYDEPSTAHVGRVIGNVNLDYAPFNWLTAKYTLGNDYYTDERLETFPPSASAWPTGQINRVDIVNRQIDSNLLLTATHSFSGNLATTLTVGHNLNSRSYRRVYVTGKDFVAPDISELQNQINWEPSEYNYLIHAESFFGQLNVDLFSQLYLTAAARNDGFSTFGPSQRRHWFPKASAAWDFTRYVGGEGRLLSYAKLRSAYGETGREPNVYDVYTSYVVGNYGESYGPYLNRTQNGIGGLTTGLRQGNFDLRPERTKEIEAGLDIGVLGDKAALGVTYYDSRSSDVIFDAPLAPSSGYTSQTRNAAKISNKGWEVTLDLRPYTSRILRWDVGLQYASNVNRVDTLYGAQWVSVGAGTFTGATGTAWIGYPVGVLRGNDFARCGLGLNINGIDIDAACGGAPKGALYIGPDGFPIQDPTTRVIANPAPNWTGSIRSGVTLYNKVQLSGLLDIKRGGQVWNGTRGALYNFGTHKDTEIRGETRTFGDKNWFPGAVGGPGAGKAVTIGEGWFTGTGGGFGPIGTQFMEDGSYVKLRELSIAYTLTAPAVRNLGFASADLRLAARNLHTWTKYTGIDPETNLGGAEVPQRGIDYFNNPQTRSFVISVGLNR